MSLKMKLVSMISAFVLVIGMLLIGVFAVERVQVDMGGSITFNADDVYARVTGSVANAQVAPEGLDVTYSAYETIGNPTAWESLDLEFDSYATPIVISITVENLSTERSLTVNLTDALTSSVPNLGKALQRDNGTYTSGTNIPLDPKDNGTSTTTFTITLSVTDKNQSLTNAQFDYDLNLYDESVAPKEILEGFIFDDSGNLTSYTGTESEVTVPSSYSMIGEPTIESLYLETTDSANEYMMTLISITNFKLTTDDGEEYIFDDFEELGSPSDAESHFPCTIEYKDYSNVTFTTGSDYQVEGVVGAFALNQTIQTVNLPDFIKNIGTYSFYDSSLSEITLPSSLTSIGDDAFEDCISLTSITLPDSLTSIGGSAFDGCTSLTGITLPSSLTSIGDRVFEGCSNLQPSITDQGVKYLGSEQNPYLVLWDGTDITASTYTVNENCKFIHSSAFSSCNNLTSITLPEGLTSIGDYAFSGCSSLTGTVTIPASVTEIGLNPFRRCSNLEGITVESGNSSYYDEGNCLIEKSTKTLITGFNNSTIPSDIKIIVDYAFFACESLTSITLPSSLTSIGRGAFSGCSSLKEVIIDSEYVYTNATSTSACGSLFDNSSITTVKVLTSLDDGTNSYITANFTKGENDVIGEKSYTVYSK